MNCRQHPSTDWEYWSMEHFKDKHAYASEISLDCPPRQTHSPTIASYIEFCNLHHFLTCPIIDMLIQVLTCCQKLCGSPIWWKHTLTECVLRWIHSLIMPTSLYDNKLSLTTLYGLSLLEKQQALIDNPELLVMARSSSEPLNLTTTY